MNKKIIQIESISTDLLKQLLNEGVTEALKNFNNVGASEEDNILLSRNETAKLLDISLVTLWKWTQKDLIQAYRIGKKVKYKKKDVLDSLQKMNKF
ncbi:helix-turn-helix domain-containing protein [Flavobacterium sp. N2270]|uniref:helix-turn-helix domain-containing protein n=1 Tax=Flavobacterium sp. N2270 TaxID=2986831 RepID=UPI0022254A98|nr:helix-turn-helix domain-containing protein [Flavobacterium sp. N2270]